MLVNSFSIDGVEYFSKVLRDRPFTLHIKFEDGINNPVSSVMKVSLYNDANLQNIFLNNLPYSIYQEGAVDVNMDFPSIRLFEGYIDKSSAPVDLSQKVIELTIIGKEKKISDTLSRYDITQLYWNPDNVISVRQAGGRTGTPRIDPLHYQSINTLIQTMFGDLGYNNIIINYRKLFFNEEKLLYRYDEITHGDIERRKDIITIKNFSIRGILKDTDSIDYSSFAIKDSQGRSYNSLLKEFAGLTGCIYFCEYRTNKIVFINRDYNFNDDLGKITFAIDDYLLDEDYKTNFKYSYNGMQLQFNDITLGLKRNSGSLLPGGSWDYGMQYDNGVLEGYAGNQFLNMGGNPLIIYRIGANEHNHSLFIDNAIELSFNANLYNYLRTASAVFSGGDAIEDFLKEFLFNNYESVLNSSENCEYGIKGIYPAPLRISLQGNEYNVFETEIDLNEEKTILRFEK